jgi:hypothetical protein
MLLHVRSQQTGGVLCNSLAGPSPGSHQGEKRRSRFASPPYCLVHVPIKYDEKM